MVGVQHGHGPTACSPSASSPALPGAGGDEAQAGQGKGARPTASALFAS